MAEPILSEIVYRDGKYFRLKDGTEVSPVPHGTPKVALLMDGVRANERIKEEQARIAITKQNLSEVVNAFSSCVTPSDFYIYYREFGDRIHEREISPDFIITHLYKT